MRKAHLLFDPRICVTMCLLLLLCVQNPVSGQNKKNDPSVWDRIEEAISKEDYQLMESLCYEVIKKDETFGSDAYKSRLLLADWYLVRSDMNGIYEQLKYLSLYSEKNPSDRTSLDYISRLSEAYNELYEQDLQILIPDGYYFSDVFSSSQGLPLVAMHVRDGQATLLQACSIVDDMKMYSMTGKEKYPVNTILMQDGGEEGEIHYSAYWGNDWVKQGNGRMAQSFMESGEEFRASAYGNMAKYSDQMSIGEALEFTLATELIGSLFDLIAEAIATSKVLARSLFIEFSVESPGVLIGELNYVVETQKTNQAPKKDRSSHRIRLYKCYPHYEIMFDRGLGSPFTYKDETGNALINKTNAAMIGSDFGFKTRTTRNKEMQRRFALKAIFGSYLNDVQPHLAEYDYENLIYSSSSITGQELLYGWDKKYKRQDGLIAVRYPNGHVEIGELAGGKLNGRYFVFNTDGSRDDYFKVADQTSGRAILREPDGAIVFDGNLENGQKSGYGKWLLADGGTYLGMFVNDRMEGEGVIIDAEGRNFVGEFVNDRPVSGTGTLNLGDEGYITGTYLEGAFTGECKIEYPNGDVYTGMVKDNVPDGAGSMTKSSSATGKQPQVIKGEWSKGVFQEPKKKKR